MPAKKEVSRKMTKSRGPRKPRHNSNDVTGFELAHAVGWLDLSQDERDVLRALAESYPSYFPGTRFLMYRTGIGGTRLRKTRKLLSEREYGGEHLIEVEPTKTSAKGNSYEGGDPRSGKRCKLNVALIIKLAHERKEYWLNNLAYAYPDGKRRMKLPRHAIGRVDEGCAQVQRRRGIELTEPRTGLGTPAHGSVDTPVDGCLVVSQGVSNEVEIDVDRSSAHVAPNPSTLSLTSNLGQQLAVEKKGCELERIQEEIVAKEHREWLEITEGKEKFEPLDLQLGIVSAKNDYR